MLKENKTLLNRDIAIIASGGIMSKEAVEQRLKQELHSSNLHWFDL